MERRRYHIKKGQKYFRPCVPIWPVAHPHGFEFEAVLDESLWFSKEEVGGDRDRGDWLKLTGITAAFGRNNYRSALIAYKPADVENIFQVTAYTNDKNGKWKSGKAGIEITTVRAGEEFNGKAFFGQSFFTDTVEYYIHTALGTYTAKHDFDTPWHRRYRQVGGAHGGKNNSPGPYGSRAVKNGFFELGFAWIT
ncbi:hypothetical protein [Phaeodactylibacter xiamenensis]|uniref:hypothetical protein n=1 Tax=Phaeodactylibacter xiamenensis TaxID=1524460 RepID=UPI0024A9D288|nr:hypothetical protein [Phaeodactylibacter xiamenensis]